MLQGPENNPCNNDHRDDGSRTIDPATLYQNQRTTYEDYDVQRQTSDSGWDFELVVFVGPQNAAHFVRILHP